MAWPIVNSRTSVAVTGINVLFHLIQRRIRSFDCEVHSRFHLRLDLGLDAIEGGLVGQFFADQILGQPLNRVACLHPLLLFILGAVVVALDVADVMPAVAIGVAEHEAGALALPRALDECARRSVHAANILPVHRLRRNPKRRRPRHNLARRGLRVVRVLVVHIVLADINHGELPERGDVHHFIERALSQRALAKEADTDAPVAELLGGERRARSNSSAPADNRIGAQVPGRRVGDVHRPALAPAIARLFAEQFGKHAVILGALGQAVSVAAVRAGDVIVGPQSGANSHGDGLFALIKVRQPRH
jgi:hypothetical protein